MGYPGCQIWCQCDLCDGVQSQTFGKHTYISMVYLLQLIACQSETATVWDILHSKSRKIMSYRKGQDDVYVKREYWITKYKIIIFYAYVNICLGVRCGRLATWFCYHLIVKLGNKTAAHPWPDPYVIMFVHVMWDVSDCLLCNNWLYGHGRNFYLI